MTTNKNVCHGFLRKKYFDTKNAEIRSIGLKVFDGVGVGLALLNGVERQGPLEVSVDPEVDVVAGVVIGAHLHEEVRAGNDLKKIKTEF